MSPTQYRESHTNHHESDLFDTWQSYYQDMMRDGMSFFQQNLDMAQRMTPFSQQSGWVEDWTRQYQAWARQFGPEMAGNTYGPETGRKVYEAWLDAWSKQMENYMQSPQFAEKSGKDLEAFSDAQKKMGDMLEAYWHLMRLPSAHDMREIYQKLYQMERKLDDLDRMIRERMPAPKAATKTKK